MGNHTKAGRRQSFQRWAANGYPYGVEPGTFTLITGASREDMGVILRRACHEVTLKGGRAFYVTSRSGKLLAWKAFEAEGLTQPREIRAGVYWSDVMSSLKALNIKPHFIAIEEVPGFDTHPHTPPGLTGLVHNQEPGPNPHIMVSTSKGSAEHPSPIELAYLASLRMHITREGEHVTFEPLKDRHERPNRVVKMEGALWTPEGISRMARTLLLGTAQ